MHIEPKIYRTRPIRAIEWNGDNNVYDFLVEWSSGQVQRDSRNVLLIQTFAGVMQIKVGDYIVKGLAGEFYPVEAECFKQAYEPISDREQRIDEHLRHLDYMEDTEGRW